MIVLGGGVGGGSVYLLPFSLLFLPASVPPFPSAPPPNLFNVKDNAQSVCYIHKKGYPVLYQSFIDAQIWNAVYIQS
jgi:hypothetical protein